MIIPSEKVAQRSAEAKNIEDQGNAVAAALQSSADANVQCKGEELMEGEGHNSLTEMQGDYDA